MIASDATLEKLAFPRVRRALAERARSRLGAELAEALSPEGGAPGAERAFERIAEVLSGGDLALGGVEDIRPLVARVRDGRMLEGPELLSIAYTLDAAGSVKRGILASKRPALSELAEGISTFDGVLRRVREQLDPDGNVRDDATPKLRDIRRRLNPLRGRIRERLQALLVQHAEHVQDAIVTIRRDRYVIPVKASSQSRVPGIALDSSDSGATVFIEPQSVVPLNNELALLEFEERDEVRRILLDLGQRLAFAPGLDASLERLAELDLIQAGASLARDWRLRRPELNDGGRVRLPGAFHPLVEGCVPNTIELDRERRLLVVTGPNAGGKTVLIKTLGLAALMAHAGLFVPSAGEAAPTLPRLDRLLIDIGDEQSIEASLSTYAGHLTNLRRIVEQSGPGVLVLIDELGSGTDPDEGAALSQAILERVLASQAIGLVTTHLAPLKVFAAQADGLQNAAMAFDVALLQPTYRLTVGQPGRSYALAIAERLGLPDALLERAAELLGPEGERLERLLETLEGQREQLARELAEAQGARDQARREAELLRAQIDKLRGREAELLAEAAERADELLQGTMQRAKELQRTARSDPEGRSQALQEIRQLRQEAQRQASRRPAPQAPAGPRLEPGAMVRVESYDAEGQVVELRGDDVVVQLGLLKVEVPRREARLLRPAGEERRTQRTAIAGSSFDAELNLRGARVEEALEQVRDFVLEAHALKVEKVRVLHGKGTGALRDAVRGYLKDEKLVERYEDAVPYEGGHGVTVAYLRL